MASAASDTSEESASLHRAGRKIDQKKQLQYRENIDLCLEKDSVQAPVNSRVPNHDLAESNIKKKKKINLISGICA